MFGDHARGAGRGAPCYVQRGPAPRSIVEGPMVWFVLKALYLVAIFCAALWADPDP
jgi:hypothetical protein